MKEPPMHSFTVTTFDPRCRQRCEICHEEINHASHITVEQPCRRCHGTGREPDGLDVDGKSWPCGCHGGLVNGWF